MDHDPRAYLFDVREAAAAIQSFISDMEFEAYVASPMVHSAVERKFEIIGEALNNLFKADQALAKKVPDLERIIAFRNLLIHGYASVSHERVWAIANDLLPRLQAVVATLLDMLER